MFRVFRYPAVRTIIVSHTHDGNIQNGNAITAGCIEVGCRQDCCKSRSGGPLEASDASDALSPEKAMLPLRWSLYGLPRAFLSVGVASRMHWTGCSVFNFVCYDKLFLRIMKHCKTHFMLMRMRFKDMRVLQVCCRSASVPSTHLEHLATYGCQCPTSPVA
jgi:hypothetical protein